MSELSTLARPYAEAAFKRAKELNHSSVWSDSLAFLAAVVQDSELSPIIKNPKIAKARLIELMLSICDTHIHGEAVNLLKTLVKNNRLPLLPQIALLYETYRADDEGYVNVDVYTAYPLTDEEQTRYLASLEKQLNKKVRATVMEDRTLLGGILAKAGDKVIDGSARGRLNQLAKKL